MVTKRVRVLTISIQLLFLLMTPLAVFSQSNAEKRKIFTQAETYFLYEEYELANPLYLLLETADNMNIKYKIGTCYLNIPGEKEKAIPYLEQAVRNASYESKTASLNEKRAPLDAYFFLGKAYLVNNQVDKALKTFTTFKKLAQETENKGGMKNVEFVDQAIQATKLALELQIAPVLFTKENLGKEINQGALNNNPAVSFDGNTLVFTERRGINSTLYYSRKENDTWSKPVELAPLINAGNDCSSCSLNKDGTLLFLYKTDNYDGNIYYSEFIKNKWTPVRKLNSNINTKYYESHAAISADGKRLYFTSNREGGFGGLDIYVSERDASGDWGPPVNLGPGVNTPFNEDTPFVTANDSLLYFCSEGHNSIGGYDIFRSRKTGNTWSKPENVGYPVNTTDDDKFFQPHNNGDNAFYAMPTEYKREEIFYLSFTGLEEETYEKFDLASIPPATGIDSSRFYNNLVLSDLNDQSVDESEVLFYTV
ncbi:MAG: PD40 domain-containing protein, partial [Bacteroidales bacterium]|nr:PD40 domain-containing protein [Bacteroidales bacterium]